MLRHLSAACLLDPDFHLPLRPTQSTRPLGSDLCGSYLLRFVEQQVRLLRGEWLTMRAETTAPQWKAKLLKLYEHLVKELKKKWPRGGEAESKGCHPQEAG